MKLYKLFGCLHGFLESFEQFPASRCVGGLSASASLHLFAGSADYLAGIFAGTAGWWFLLSSGINLFRKRFHLRQMLIINRVSGIMIALLGLASVVEGLAQLVFHQTLL